MPVPHPQDHDEEGFALFYALLVTLIVGGIVAVVFATAISENRQAALELDFEDTVHVSEAGAEQMLQLLAADATVDSGIAGPGAGDAAAWAIGEALRQVGGAYVHEALTFDLGEGEGVALRPNDDDAEFIYGVGFTPSRDAYDPTVGDSYARVVRVQVAFTPSAFASDVALLAGKGLTLNGAVSVTSSTGNGMVHTNGALTINGGGGGVVEDGATHTGSGPTCASSSSAPCPYAVTGPVDPYPVPEIDILATWNTELAELVAADGDWYDRCAGIWYRRGELDTAPCTGTPVGSPPGWSGNSFSTPTGTLTDHVFFIYEDVEVDITRIDGKASFLSKGDLDVGPQAGQPPFAERLPGILMLSEGRIEINGNASFESTTPALVMAQEEVVIGGNLESTNIAYIARDVTGSGTTLGGGPKIHYNGGAIGDIGGGGYPVVVQWDEVR